MKYFVKILMCLLLTVMFTSKANAYVGTVKGYISPNTSNVKIGDNFSVKIMMDTGNYQISVVSVKLSIDTTKVKVTKVFLNSNVFGNSFLSEEVGGVVSLYGASNNTTVNLPKGIIEVGSMNLEAVAAGEIGIGIRLFEVSGPGTGSNLAVPYDMTWTNGTVNITSGIVQPTPTQVVGNGINGVLKFKVAFAGVSGNPACSDWPVDVMVMESNGNSKTYPNIKLSSSREGQILLTGVSAKTNLAVFIKGPRHVQTKYANDSQGAFYNQPGGNIVVDTDASKTKVYDFSKYALLAGDVNRDGVVDGLDFSMVKSDVSKRSEGQAMVSDLNGNCKLESVDLTLLMLAMKDKQEQLY